MSTHRISSEHPICNWTNDRVSAYHQLVAILKRCVVFVRSMFKENVAKSAHAELDLQSDLTGLHDWRHALACDIITKEGNRPWLMITIDNMHQGYIFRVCSVELLVVQCYRFSWCCSFCLLALLHIPSWEGEGAGGRVHACCTLLLQLPSVWE